ncbi:MAG: DUF2752 domain-containing protein [Clostridia bacterium]|nr:DUF2752 domain-containing protein [Clostridia bacterium]
MKRISNLKTKLILTALYIIIVLILSKLGFSCVFREYLGIQCPGCGMTRAYASLLKLDVVSAFKYHPMFWSVPLIYAYILFDLPLFSRKIDKIILLSILFGFLLVFGVRITSFFV